MLLIQQCAPKTRHQISDHTSRRWVTIRITAEIPKGVSAFQLYYCETSEIRRRADNVDDQLTVIERII